MQAAVSGRELSASEFAETPNRVLDPFDPGAACAQSQAVPEPMACGEDVPWREADAMVKSFVEQGPGVEPPGQSRQRRSSIRNQTPRKTRHQRRAGDDCGRPTSVAPTSTTTDIATRCLRWQASVPLLDPIQGWIRTAPDLRSPDDVLIRALLRASGPSPDDVRQATSRKIQGSDVLIDGQAALACSWRSSIPTQQADRPAPSPSPTALSPP